MRVTISSRTGKVLCTAFWMARIAEEVGEVGLGGGSVESTGYSGDEGSRRERASTICNHILAPLCGCSKKHVLR